MADKFTFNEFPARIILNNADKLIKGINVVDAIYYSPETEDLQAERLSRINGKIRIEEFQIEKNLLSQIQKLREEKATFKWFDKKSLPYKIKKIDNPQINLFDEKNYVILLVKFKNIENDKFDLIFFHFNPHGSNFGLSSQKKNLTPEQKAIISNLLCNSINIIIDNAKNDYLLFKIISKRLNRSGEQMSEKEKKISKLNNKLGLSYLRLSQHYLEKHSERNKINFILSDVVKDKIINYTGEHYELEEIINQAVLVAGNTVDFKENTVVKILESHIDFTIKTDKYQSKVKMTERNKRTVKLLNNLERAAIIVENNNLSFTGKNIGKAHENPITHAAITDALKKQKKTVKTLISDYPDEWKIIRNKFKPLLNILEENKYDDENVDAAG